MTEKFRVKEIVTKTKVTDNPVIVNFQNGQIQPDKANACFFKAKDSQDSSKEFAVVATQSSIYRGPINEDKASSLVNHFLAIKNRNTGKVRIVQIDNASLIHNSYFKRASSLVNQFTQETAYATLVKNFGGKKAVRALDRRERMQVNIEIVKGQLEQTLEDSIVEENDKLETSLNEMSFNKIRPPFNAEAKRVEEVYQLKDIIPNELLDRMDAEANAVLETDVDQLPITSEFLKSKLKSIQEENVSNTSKNLTLVKIIIYLDALQNLIRTKEKNFKAMTISNITEKVETDIQTRFSEPNLLSLKKTRYTKEKAICYYLALVLITSPGYEANLNSLSAELDMSRQTIVKYAQILHAIPISKTELLRLRLPSEVKIKSTFMNKRKTR